jgi:hypothetical protein
MRELTLRFGEPRLSPQRLAEEARKFGEGPRLDRLAFVALALEPPKVEEQSAAGVDGAPASETNLGGRARQPRPRPQAAAPDRTRNSSIAARSASGDRGMPPSSPRRIAISASRRTFRFSCSASSVSPVALTIAMASCMRPTRTRLAA